MTGREVAELCRPNAVFVRIGKADWYNPSEGEINLLPATASGTDLQQHWIAAHECAHAWQHRRHAFVFELWSSVLIQEPWIPCAGACASIVAFQFVFVIGVVLIALTLSLVALRTFLTLWIERDANWRAGQLLAWHKLIDLSSENPAAKATRRSRKAAQ